GVQLTEERTRPAQTRSGGRDPGVGDDQLGPPRAPSPGPGQCVPQRLAARPAGLVHVIAEAKAGCSLCFEYLYRQLAGQVASYLRWHRASDPDGLTNDVFAQVHRNIRSFEGDEPGFRPGLFNIPPPP